MVYHVEMVDLNLGDFDRVLAINNWLSKQATLVRSVFHQHFAKWWGHCMHHFFPTAVHVV